jgi:hypothetical protein
VQVQVGGYVVWHARYGSWDLMPHPSIESPNVDRSVAIYVSRQLLSYLQE